jgi:hypothetical protein
MAVVTKDVTGTALEYAVGRDASIFQYLVTALRFPWLFGFRIADAAPPIIPHIQKLG